MITEQIEKYLKQENKSLNEEVLKLATDNFKYISEKNLMSGDWDSKGKVYPSQLGKCPRAVWYGYTGIEKTNPPETRINLSMWFGSLLEIGLVMLIRLAGFQMETQKKIEFNLEGRDFRGYLDGVLDYNKDKYIVEMKSQSQFAFREFETKGFDRDDYLVQLSLYQQYSGIGKGIFLCVNRNTGHIAEKVMQLDTKYITMAKECVKQVLGKDTPAKKFSPKMMLAKKEGDEIKGFVEEGKEPKKSKYTFMYCSLLPWQCSYCSWCEHCNPDYKLVFVSGKPYRIKER